MKKSIAGAFSGAGRLTDGFSIDWPSNITVIPEDCFASSGLKSINIPNTVTSIQNNVFYDCEKITEIEIPVSVETIGYGAFRSCTALTSVNILGQITKLNGGTLYYTRGVFEGCTNLTTISLPETLMVIETNSFLNCNNLTTVNYAGSSTQWNNINISNTGNDAMANATINYGK